MSGASADQAATRSEVEQRDKRITTVRARCALAGFELMIVSGADRTGAFLISRWGRSRELRDVADVERFLEQAGAR